MVEGCVHQVCLFRAPIWYGSGGSGTREARGTVAESLVYRVSAHQIRQGLRIAQSSTSRGSAEPLCARIKGMKRKVSDRKTISDNGLFSSYVDQQEAANGQDSWGVFQGCTGLWMTGCWLARRLY